MKRNLLYGAAILISDKIDFKTKTVTKEKKSIT